MENFIFCAGPLPVHPKHEPGKNQSNRNRKKFSNSTVLIFLLDINTENLH